MAAVPDIQGESRPAKVLVLGEPGALGETLVRRLSAAGVSAQFTNPPVLNGTPANGVRLTANGEVSWLVGNLGDIPAVTLDYRTYSAVGWTIEAREDGTRFTNDRSGHGMTVLFVVFAIAVAVFEIEAEIFDGLALQLFADAAIDCVREPGGGVFAVNGLWVVFE